MLIKNRKLLLGAGILIVILILFFAIRGTGSASASDIIVEVEQGEFVVDVNITGELEARSSTNIMGPTGLRNYRIYNVTIQDILDEGSLVKKGQYIARLDPSELTTKIKDTQLELEEKESQYIQTQLDTTLQMRQARDNNVNLKYAVEEKQLILEQSKYEPPATIKQAEIDLEKAKRAYSQALEEYRIKRKQNAAKMHEVSITRRKKQNELDGMLELQKSFVITAPEDGMLIYYKRWGETIKEGSQVSTWDPVVATLPDLSEMNSVTYVNEVDIRKIAEGQKVDVGLDAFPDKRLSGEVSKVANVGEQRPNSDAKVFLVSIALDNIDESLRPSMTTSNRIYTNVLEDATYIPLECLHNFADSVTYIYKKAGLGYTKQEVQVGLTNANSAQILLGAKKGEQVYLSIPSEDGSDINLLPEMNGKRGQSKEEEKPKEPKEEPKMRKGPGKKRPTS